MSIGDAIADLISRSSGDTATANPLPKRQLLFSRKTSERLDTLKRYLGDGDHPKARIRGGLPSRAVLEEFGLRDMSGDAWPRHQRAYELIAQRFEGFSWQPCSASDGRRWVTFQSYPLVDRAQPSLADLSIESLRQTYVPEAPQHLRIDLFAPNVQRRIEPLLRTSNPQQIGAHDPRGAAFARALVDLPIAYPPFQIMDAVRVWLERVLAGEPSTIVTPVCPDYAMQETDDPMRPRVYTFDALGTDVGHVAQRALVAFRKLAVCFHGMGCTNIRFVAAIGDTEADSPENCSRVRLSRDEFITRLRQSQAAFAASCVLDLPLETPLITEIDRPLWECLFADARACVARRDYGPLGLTEEDIAIILKARRSLYERWNGASADVRAMLDSQAPEYMATTELFLAKYPNVLVLGADATAMSPFAQGMGRTIRPVLHLRHIDY